MRVNSRKSINHNTLGRTTMSTKYFNFNNEADQVAIEVNDETGVVTIMNTDFESVQAFAEFYALNRDVRADNLKNWVLVEDGSRVSFVLRAGTAGADFSDLVASLRAAGMTPEEIGRALAAATEAQTAQVEPQTLRVAQSAREEILEEFLSTRSYAGYILPKVLGADFRHHFERVELDTERYDEFEDEVCYVDEDEAAWDYLEDAYSEGVTALTASYPGVPFDVAVAVETGDFSELTDDRDEIEKRFVVAELASRPRLEVVTVDTRAGKSVRTELLTKFEAYGFGELFYEDNKIVRVIR